MIDNVTESGYNAEMAEKLGLFFRNIVLCHRKNKPLYDLTYSYHSSISYALAPDRTRIFQKVNFIINKFIYPLPYDSMFILTKDKVYLKDNEVKACCTEDFLEDYFAYSTVLDDSSMLKIHICSYLYDLISDTEGIIMNLNDIMEYYKYIKNDYIEVII